jgi:predicted nucleic acid-binding protein
MIVDSSALIELLRDTGSPSHLRLQHAIQRREAFSVPAIVRQEVLQGARSEADFARLDAYLDALPPFEPEDTAELHRQAALLYARCRWTGLTPRSPIDCIVAACALEAGVPLLANDRDFSVIASIEHRLVVVP